MNIGSNIDRRDLLAPLVPNPDDYLIVTGLAGPARDAAALTKDGGNTFTMAGCMGASVPMGLGMALAAATRQIMVITGDGELLMNIGSLACVATMQPSNLSIICIDNGCHGETGGQAGHTAYRTDLEQIARGAGLPSTMLLSESSEISRASQFLRESSSPRFLLCRVTDGPPTAFKRNLDPLLCRERFKAYVAETS